VKRSINDFGRFSTPESSTKKCQLDFKLKINKNRRPQRNRGGRLRKREREKE
jgi:hypothetical protein